MLNSNQNKLRGFVGVASPFVILSLLICPTVSHADEEIADDYADVEIADDYADEEIAEEEIIDDDIDVYYTFHNDLGGRVISDCDMAVDFMEEYFSIWIYDGEREWYVDRTGFGFYTLYEVDDCRLYTNSLSVKFVLNILGIPRVGGYTCIQQDVR